MFTISNCLPLSQAQTVPTSERKSVHFALHSSRSVFPVLYAALESFYSRISDDCARMRLSQLGNEQLQPCSYTRSPSCFNTMSFSFSRLMLNLAVLKLRIRLTTLYLKLDEVEVRLLQPKNDT